MRNRFGRPPAGGAGGGGAGGVGVDPAATLNNNVNAQKIVNAIEKLKMPGTTQGQRETILMDIKQNVLPNTAGLGNRELLTKLENEIRNNTGVTNAALKQLVDNQDFRAAKIAVAGDN